MDSASVQFLATLSSVMFLLHGCSCQGVTALYNQTIVVPCNGGAPPPEDLMFIKWKYEKDDGNPGDLLVKQARSHQATLHATDDYRQRVSVDQRLSLVITAASLRDQRTFTCMVVSANNILEYPVAVSVEKEPSSLQVLDKAQVLQRDKLSTVGTCVAAEANPAALITWLKNAVPLVADEKDVLIISSSTVDPATGLSTTSSTLQVVPTRQDSMSVFSCVSKHQETQRVLDLDPVPVHYPPEKISLLILSSSPVVEGDNVTLRCQADGNPPPKSFYFHMKEKKVLVEDANSFTLSTITREAGGEYKCSLADNEKMEASQNLDVNYLDLRLTPSGVVVKNVGDDLSIRMEKNSSADVNVSWTKNGVTVQEPRFTKLMYADAGVYTCEVSMMGITQQQSFQLLVEGKPVITSLTKHSAKDAKHTVLTCEAEGVPEPSFDWSINVTNEESWYRSGKAVHEITVVPSTNLTVTCTVSNRLGDDAMMIHVSSESSGDSQDQATLIGGLVGGLVLAATMVALIYWLYKKNFRRGSWKAGEEVGTREESKKLEASNRGV